MSDQPRGQPRKPQTPTPHPGSSPASNSDGRTPSGIPEESKDHQPTGWPSDDRHETEVTPSK